MGQVISIGTIDVLAIAGMGAAFALGVQQGKPKKKWPKGGLLDFAYAPWRVPLFIILVVSFLAIMFGHFISQMFGSMGGGGGMSGGGGGGRY